MPVAAVDDRGGSAANTELRRARGGPVRPVPLPSRPNPLRADRSGPAVATPRGRYTWRQGDPPRRQVRRHSRARGGLQESRDAWSGARALSFSRFLGLAIEDGIPDATTLWLFREKLARAGLIEQLFDRFDQHLAAKGYMARGGQIIDASIVLVPTQRNSRDENAELQAGRTPAGPRSSPNSGPVVTTVGFIDAVGAIIRCL